MLKLKPNILYLNSHDTGRFIQPYGHAIATPSLQRLAEEGVLFRQAFCAGPTCSPSRAALVTGAYPHENGMVGLAHRGFSLKDYSWHLADTLRQAGYQTALAGFQHVAADTAQIGYEKVFANEAGDGEDASVARAACDFLESHPHEPFYLEVGFMDTHREFPEADPGDGRCILPPAGLPDTPETRYDMACFKRSARRLDDHVGQVLSALAAAGLAESTLVICTTDHGIAFPGMKCTLTDGGIGVMLMMRGPGGFSGGKVVDAMVSHLDIYPTICEIAGVEAPPWIRGGLLVPLARGDADEIHEEVFAEVTYHAAYEPQRAVRTKRWKYIRRFGDRMRVVLPNCDDGPSKTLLMNHGWGDLEHPREALYDLAFDPDEANNLAASPEAAAILDEMRARLDRWMKETDDPLLTGPVPAPPGARVNDPDGISPTEKPRIIGQ
ncbi:MAG: sulfatase family protein [Planctomycetota bacterium]